MSFINVYFFFIYLEMSRNRPWLPFTQIFYKSLDIVFSELTGQETDIIIINKIFNWIWKMTGYEVKFFYMLSEFSLHPKSPVQCPSILCSFDTDDFIYSNFISWCHYRHFLRRFSEFQKSLFVENVCSASPDEKWIYDFVE